jgi:hypothetical protein
MQIKTMMRYNLTQLEWLLLRRQVTDAGMDVEKEQLSYTSDGRAS